MSVMQEGSLYLHVILQEQPNCEHNNWDPSPPTFQLLYARGQDFFTAFCYSDGIFF